MIVDVRKMKDSDVDGYRFDDSDDYVYRDMGAINMFVNGKHACLCDVTDLDNFIKALQLAKEMK